MCYEELTESETNPPKNTPKNHAPISKQQLLFTFSTADICFYPTQSASKAEAAKSVEYSGVGSILLYLAVEVIAGASCTFLRALLCCPHLFVTITEVSCMRKPGSLEIVKHQILFNIYFRWAYFLHLKKVKCHNNHFNIPHFLFVECLFCYCLRTYFLPLHSIFPPPLAPLPTFFLFPHFSLLCWRRESLVHRKFPNFNLPVLFSSIRNFSYSPSALTWDQPVDLLTSSGSRIHSIHTHSSMMFYLGGWIGGICPLFSSSLWCLIQCQCNSNSWAISPSTATC